MLCGWRITLQRLLLPLRLTLFIRNFLRAHRTVHLMEVLLANRSDFYLQTMPDIIGSSANGADRNYRVPRHIVFELYPNIETALQGDSSIPPLPVLWLGVFV